MNFSDDILKKSEIAVLRLRELFSGNGYERYEMNNFEEYELYAANKAFLGSDDIITFTNPGGRLMAMRPDVTLSIVKNTKSAAGGVTRLYYNENVYRRAGSEGELRERAQAGVECIGDIGVREMSEVIALAVKSLDVLTERGGEVRQSQSQCQSQCIDVSHMGFLGGLLDGLGLPPSARAELLRRVGEKNVPEVSRLAARYGAEAERALSEIISLDGAPEASLKKLASLAHDERTAAAARELDEVTRELRRLCPDADIRIDFSVVSDLGYYDGIMFQGYIEGIPEAVLSGGRYDGLMKKFGRRQGAVGFAVYADLLERGEPVSRGVPDGMLNIALPKGRLGETVYGLFEKAGYGCEDVLSDTRKLVFENAAAGVRYFWVKPSDVAIYVERGAADLGVVGSDVLAEQFPAVYELADLKAGLCRLVVAAREEFNDTRGGALRVATKFVNVARDYYDSQNREIDIIELHGSVELAPLLGLSDVIVDIVSTGATLRENGLVEKEEVCHVSARLIANKTGYKFKHNAAARLAEKISEIINN
ncbi:MAG: ATP phosphoribosyltransferase [Oscillospiraceae bacterium]|jgi:ATP phosphoribosyltransferase regulatory subunit|nr:ATP phosphoribosyltransferase [Oscillospiraceae bacterium]